MSSQKRDKVIAKKESDTKRNKKKDCSPTDNYGERYVTGKEKERTQGKGDSYRIIDGWYSDEMTEKFNKIFNRRKKEWKKNSTTTNGKTVKYYPSDKE